MKILIILLRKEFRQIFRDKTILAMIIVVPLVQLLILPLAADFDIKHINLSVVDQDHSPLSQELVSSIASSGYFKITPYTGSYSAAIQQIENRTADIILEIPNNFQKNLVREGNQSVLISADAINGTKAGLGNAYLSSIITGFNRNIKVARLRTAGFNDQTSIDVRITTWFNPYLNYRFYMVPGILVILVTMVAGYMSALNIVREKEIGTIEQINVSPIKKYHFILGKMIPFWLMGMIVFSLGLILARLIYGIIPAGNIGLLYIFLAVYLVAILGFGLLVSTYCENQLQSMFVAFFFIMIFILMSGLFTSIDSMPAWARTISRLTPVTYFIEVMRMLVLKGSTFTDIREQLLIVAVFAITLNGWAVWNYRKTS
jgi:ABC-2 type transport system permease protein